MENISSPKNNPKDWIKEEMNKAIPYPIELIEGKEKKLVNPPLTGMDRPPVPGGSKANEAIFLERFKDHIQVKLAHWMFDNALNLKDYEVVKSFVHYLIKETDEDLIAPRGRDGKSFKDCLGEV